MTREETAQILAVIETTYPNYKQKDRTLAINLWHSILGSYDYRIVLIALQTYIAGDEKGFPPVPGQINAQIGKMQQTNEDIMTDMEAWSLAYKAICNSAYHSQEEYDKLPPDIQRAVGSANQMHAWAIDEDFSEGVVMSQFIKSYRSAKTQREEREKIPANIRNLIEDTTKRLNG